MTTFTARSLRLVITSRCFLGNSPEVEQAVRTIIEENLSGYIEEAINYKIHKKREKKYIRCS